MISTTPERRGKAVGAMLLVVMAVLLLLTAFQKQHWDSDIFWALKSGEWITSHFSVPKTDPFSYTFVGQPWVDFTWGFQVIAYAFFTLLGGWTGLFILQILVTGLTFVVIYRSLRDAAPGMPWVVAALVILVFAASYQRIFIRPHLFGYLLISVYILLLNSYEKTGRWKHLWVLPLLQVLWVNIHSSAVLGIFITGAYAAGALIDELRAERYSFKKKLSVKTRHIIAVSIAVPLFSIINPYGPLLSLFPFIHQNADNMDALRHIAEWTKVPLDELFFIFYPVPITYLAFRLVVVLTVLALVLNFRRIRTRDLIILAGALYMAMSHIRWLPIVGYFAAPIIAANLSSVLSEKPWHKKAVRRVAALAAVFVLVFVACDYGSRTYRAHFGLGLEYGAYPEGTVGFLKREGITGNVYNEYIFGGYLIYETPGVRPFIDGRTPTVYSPYHFWTFRITTDPEMWDRLEKEHSLDIALIKPNVEQCVNLWKNPSWHAVSIDDLSVLFLKDTPRFAPVIERYGMKNTPPCYRAKKYELPQDAPTLELVRSELTNQIHTQPVDNAVTHWLLGRATATFADARSSAGEPDQAASRASAKAYYTEAIREFVAAARIRDDKYISYDLGVAYVKAGNMTESAAAYDRAISFDKKFEEAYLGAGLALHDAGDYEGAVERLKEYVSIADDKSTKDAYKTLGISCFETGDLGCAEAYLKRAAFIAPNEVETADLNLRLGNVYMEMGRIDDAAVRYRASVNLHPAFEGSLRAMADDFVRTGKKDVARTLYDILDSIKSTKEHDAGNGVDDNQQTSRDSGA